MLFRSLRWANDKLWISKKDDQYKENALAFYKDKTLLRIHKFLEKYNLKDEFDVINGTLVPSMETLLEMVDFDSIIGPDPTGFHGDFILDNIIETEDGFCLIDWRQDFAGDLEIGDMYYDLAKLNHNLTVNHDIVSKNLFSPSSDNCYILTNSTLNECKIELESFIKENSYDIKKVNILTSLIWINMAPLHEYPFNNFLFNFGKYNLFKQLK